MLIRIPRSLALLASAMTVSMILAQAPFRAASSGIAQSKQDPLAKAFRVERNGWTYVHLEGSPEEVGYQHGYLLAREIDESLRVFKKYLPRTTKREWQFYRDSAHQLFWKKIGDEYQKEIEGIARGASARGVKIDTDDVLAMNGWIELASYYVPSLQQARLTDPELHQSPPPSCSAFIATGSWTANSANARHRRWDELMKLNKGKIDINLAKKFEADHYDVVHKREAGSANTLCGHVEVDELGLPEWD